MNVIVTGGDMNDAQARRVHTVLDNLHKGTEIDTVICGASKGADYAAFQWAMINSVKACVYPIDWGKLGNRAYETRNHRMLKEYQVGAVIAFPGPPRVKHLIDIAKDLGIQVLDDLG